LLLFVLFLGIPTNRLHQKLAEAEQLKSQELEKCRAVSLVDEYNNTRLSSAQAKDILENLVLRRRYPEEQQQQLDKEQQKDDSSAIIDSVLLLQVISNDIQLLQNAEQVYQALLPEQEQAADELIVARWRLLETQTAEQAAVEQVEMAQQQVQLAVAEKVRLQEQSSSSLQDEYQVACSRVDQVVQDQEYWRNQVLESLTAVELEQWLKEENDLEHQRQALLQKVATLQQKGEQIRQKILASEQLDRDERKRQQRNEWRRT
jgi:hypothetical protein